MDVTFDIDANGILNVSATDKATGKEQRITITASSGLADDEVERLVREAEEHAAEDSQRRELVETRNQADNSAYQAEKMVQEYAEKIDDSLKASIEDKVANVRTLLTNEDADLGALRAAIDELGQEVQKIGEAIYAQQQSEASEASSQDPADDNETSSDSDSDDDTVEGKYREV